MATIEKGKHTAGPWNYQLLAGGYDLAIYSESDGKDLALVRNAHEANARLIAAAPELLEALIALYNAAPAAKPANADLWNALQLTRAAIAKAEGRE